MSETIAIVAAHPDDEVLGCGGTAIAHAQRGDDVHILILAEGLTSRDPERDIAARADELAAWQETAKRAGELLGARSVSFAGLPDNRMDGLDLLDVVKHVEAFLASIKANRIYTHHGGDLNIDHRLTHQAVITAARPQGQETPALFFFEVPSSTEWATPGSFAPFLPGWYQDISATLETKLKALSVYADEMCPWPHPRSVEAVRDLARLRGAQVVLPAAEAFMLGRMVACEKGNGS